MRTSLPACWFSRYTPTEYRDQVSELAKTNVSEASKIAEKITDPWLQSQGWAHIARHADRPLLYARKAVKSALLGKDDYQKSAVRAWEIAALAERGYGAQARRSLGEAAALARTVEPVSSRAEALILLFQAAFKVSLEDASGVAEVLKEVCASDHWRAKRARRVAGMMLAGLIQPREFYW